MGKMSNIQYIVYMLDCSGSTVSCCVTVCNQVSKIGEPKTLQTLAGLDCQDRLAQERRSKIRNGLITRSWIRSCTSTDAKLLPKFLQRPNPLRKSGAKCMSASIQSEGSFFMLLDIISCWTCVVCPSHSTFSSAPAALISMGQAGVWCVWLPCAAMCSLRLARITIFLQAARNAQDLGPGRKKIKFAVQVACIKTGLEAQACISLQ